MWDSVVILISNQEITDDAGDIIENQEEENQIFCNELSVGQSEFYQAMATGFKPEIKLEVYKAEYSGEKQVKYCETVYDVIRTFSQKGSDILELTLGGKVNATT